jgi:hypothetical protein
MMRDDFRCCNEKDVVYEQELMRRGRAEKQKKEAFDADAGFNRRSARHGRRGPEMPSLV